MKKEEVKNLQITGMHCASCAMNIDFELEDLPGVIESNTSYAKQVTQVKIDPEKVKDDEMFGAIEKLGYKAKVMSQ